MTCELCNKDKRTDFELPEKICLTCCNKLWEIWKEGQGQASYKNKDPRCRFPHNQSPLGYCWAYAHHVDGTKGHEDMEKICPGCEYWEDNE